MPEMIPGPELVIIVAVFNGGRWGAGMLKGRSVPTFVDGVLSEYVVRTWRNVQVADDECIHGICRSRVWDDCDPSLCTASSRRRYRPRKQLLGTQIHGLDRIAEGIPVKRVVDIVPRVCYFRIVNCMLLSDSWMHSTSPTLTVTQDDGVSPPLIPLFYVAEEYDSSGPVALVSVVLVGFQPVLELRKVEVM